MRCTHIGTQFVLSLLFSVGIAWADSEEINYLEKFFQINPNEINYEDLEPHFPEAFQSWDFRFENWKGDPKDLNLNSVDHKSLKFKRNSEEWDLRSAKMKDDKLILFLTILKVKETSPCKKYYSQAEKFYGKEVLSFFDSTDLVGTYGILTAEASFDFANSRISFWCFGAFGGSSPENNESTYIFQSGSKDDIKQTLPRTFIHCKEQHRSYNVDIPIKNTRVLEEFTQIIDHDDKKLLIHNKSRRAWTKVLEFTDNQIKVQTIGEKNKQVYTLTMTINRLTGNFREQRSLPDKNMKRIFKKDPILTISGKCEKIEAKKKF